MAFLSVLLSLFLSLFSIFSFGGSSGGGAGKVFLSEAQASAAYQNGSWDGSKAGRFEVRDGLLYVDGKTSDYPADSSRNYYRPVIVSTDRGTWFEYNPSDGILAISFDYRGQNLYEMNLSSYLRGCVEYSTTVTSTEIVYDFVYRDGTTKQVNIKIDITPLSYN